jgi:LmbE family N-acetylglucosaminyl deacetylase
VPDARRGLGAGTGDLAAQRTAELSDAARVLGCARTTLLAHPDGALADLDVRVIEAEVEAEVRATQPDGILVVDPLGGVTGHPDHREASEAALAVAARHGIPVLGWALPQQVSRVLNDTHGAAFAGHPLHDLTAIAVDRCPVTSPCGRRLIEATDSVVSAPPGRG